MGTQLRSTSWLDRLVEWATTRRAPWWVVALAAIAINMALTMLSVGVLVGAGREATLYWLSQSVYGVLSLLAYGAETRQTGRAFDRFEPALRGRSAEAESWLRVMTSMSNRMASIVVLVAAPVAFGAFVTDPFLVDAWAASPVGAGLMFVVLWFNLTTLFIAMVQLVRIARGVTAVHRLAGDIDLFAPDPVHAFAGATGVGGGVIILLFTYSAATDPQTFENPVWLSLIAVVPLAAFLLFFLPLLGMRRRLKELKGGMLDASMSRIRSVAADLDAVVDGRRFDEVATLKTAIDALERERERIQAASTWPWDGGTLRVFVPTLLLPFLTWFVTSVAGKLLGL